MLKQGSLGATILLGLIATIKAFLPYTLRLVLMDPTSQPTYYEYAWTIWTYSNPIIWGILSILWPLTYLDIRFFQNFYTWYYKSMGIIVGYMLTIAISGLFFWPAYQQDISWNYFIIYFSSEFLLLLTSNLYYRKAKLWYKPEQEIEEEVSIEGNESLVTISL